MCASVHILTGDGGGGGWGGARRSEIDWEVRVRGGKVRTGTQHL